MTTLTLSKVHIVGEDHQQRLCCLSPSSPKYLSFRSSGSYGGSFSLIRIQQSRRSSAFRFQTCCMPVASSQKADDTGFSKKKLAVFVSGGGSNFKAIHKACLENRVYGEIVAVVSDKPACKACEYAKENSIPVLEFPKSKNSHTGLSPIDLVDTFRKCEVDFVLLAGYLKLLPGELVQAFPRAILNIHPALLPAFGGKGYYGRKVHEAVIKSGARYSGPTVHFVDEIYDHGMILAQKVVSVLPYDTPDELASRVLKEEHNLYPEVVAALCEDRIFWREDGVPLIRKSWAEADYY